MCANVVATISKFAISLSKQAKYSSWVDITGVIDVTISHVHDKKDSPLNLQEAPFARRDELPLEVEVLRLEELLRPPYKGETTKPTRTQFHSLLLIESGTSSHHVDFERQRVGPGDLLVIPQGSVQAFDRARVIGGHLVLFTADFLQRCNLSVAKLDEACRVLTQTALHVSLGDESFSQAQRAISTLASFTRSPGRDRFAGESIAAAISLVVFSIADLPETTAALEARAPQDRLVARFEELLETQFCKAHRAAPYARNLRTSLRTLDRRLLADRGQTARQAISARLVLEARRRLTTIDTPVKNIAYDLGFSEPQNFTRFFRSQTGLSPQAFRESLDL